MKRKLTLLPQFLGLTLSELGLNTVWSTETSNVIGSSVFTSNWNTLLSFMCLPGTRVLKQNKKSLAASFCRLCKKSYINGSNEVKHPPSPTSEVPTFSANLKEASVMKVCRFCRKLCFYT